MTEPGLGSEVDVLVRDRQEFLWTHNLDLCRGQAGCPKGGTGALTAMGMFVCSS